MSVTGDGTHTIVSSGLSPFPSPVLGCDTLRPAVGEGGPAWTSRR